jgi:hypothetical protein
MTKELIDAVNNHDYTYKDEKSNEQRLKVVKSLLRNEKCTSTALLRGFIDGCGKLEFHSDADKALHPFVELAKMYNCYHIEQLRTIQFLSWLREHGWLNGGPSNEEMIKLYDVVFSERMKEGIKIP